MLASALAAAFTCTPAQVWDGDSFTCADGTKVRVAAIATREIKRVGSRMVDNGCKDNHPCPTMDAVKARDVLVSKLGRPIGTGLPWTRACQRPRLALHLERIGRTRENWRLVRYSRVATCPA